MSGVSNVDMGQIFVGAALIDFDDNDITRRIFGNNYKSGKAGFIVTGLPNLGNGGTSGFSLQDLANLSPAAGGEESNGDLDIEDLNNLEPAADGNDKNLILSF